MSEKRGQLDALLDVALVLGDGVTARGEAPVPADHEPTRLGKYELVRLLGAGGMGDVWEARDVELDRRVALKLIRPRAIPDAVARARLIREARAMARLRHPNVIGVFDAITIDGRDAIALELVDGETLAAWLARARPLDEVLAMVIAAGRGLAAAHAAGVVHRDFKPQNVLVDAGGRAVVTDFGLAHAPGDSAERGDAHPGALDSPLTITGTVLGTPAYMAPEQRTGLAADERADQYSFAVTLWQAVAGALPSDDSTRRIPRRLRAVLWRALAVEPDRRWPSMDALLAAIERAWRRPRRIALALGAVGAVAAIAVLARSGRAPWRPQIVDLPAFEENSDGFVISPDGTRIAYVSDRERTGVFRLYVAPLAGGEARAVTPAGDTFQTPRWTRDGAAVLLLRWEAGANEYRVVRQPIAGGPPVELGPGVGADDCGDALAIAEVVKGEGRLVLRRADGRRDVITSAQREGIFSPRCDATGQRIVFMRGAAPIYEPIDDLVVTDRGGHELQLTHGHATSGGVFTPDGRSVVFSALADGKVYLYEIPSTGGVARRLTSQHGPHLNPDISPDGRILAFDRDVGGTVLLAGGGAAPRTLTARRETLLSIAATRDRAWVIASRLVEGGNEVVAIATRDGVQRTLARGLNPFLSRDDRRVLFAAVDAPPRLLSIPIEGGPIATVALLPGTLVGGADGPDAVHVSLTRGGASEAWRVEPDGRVEPEGVAGLVIPAPSGGWRAVRTFDAGYHLRFVAPGAPLTESGREVVAVSARPTWLDDRRLAYLARGSIRVVDVTTGADVATAPGPAWGEHGVVAVDGVHWFGLQLVGHVTRHLIVNFGDRPRY